ncbi:sugar phosphate isomerase/epimerase family protein [Zophobihabitans entericus]|uniref:Sugar phosphate isomerase/epimerase n=1 Tax=Zophobihabitans entericus TaxID=1635327 RepID=A0A6G9I9U3_9GAMM|nr:sugar phosphate isomerase/epimerase [Zophobihabitans entericus]QIQ20991.1 sugar phosphate isomerase/epimerase [Zophobihabitans entericus]
MARDIIIVSSAYGYEKIQQLGGQSEVLGIVKKSGAEGIEIRRELFSEQDLQTLPQLSEKIKSSQLSCFYSVPYPLFMSDGTVNSELDKFLAEAKQLSAKLIKFSLGHYQAGTDLTQLKQTLSTTSIQLVVENDQTECGVVEPFKLFFRDVMSQQVPVKMTFDTGNWLWVGGNPTESAKQLAKYVGYIHVKAAEMRGGKACAIPPTGLDDEWMKLVNYLLPLDVPRGIEFPLEGNDLVSVSSHFVNLLKQ